MNENRGRVAKSKIGESSWGRIIVGHIFTYLFGGLALITCVAIFWSNGIFGNLLYDILAVVLGLVGLIYGLKLKHTSGGSIEVDENTGHAIKRKL